MSCFFFPIVYLLLTSTSTASGDQIRLAGSTRCSGRVEIYHNNTWGTVCDDDWDLNDAKVVCRQLGCGTSLEALQSAHFGQGTGQIWLDDVSCSGSEWSLTECQHRGFGTHNCGHGEDAGVVCSGDQIRLAGPGSTQCSGRVEIYHSYTWGTVCDDDWDINDAKVVCRQLGCGTSLEAPQSAHFGQGTGEIWLDDVSCSGSERSLTACRHRGFGTHNCGHSEDAGVVCSVDVPKPSISMNPTGEVNWGQNVGITCSVSTQVSGGTFILKKTSGSYRKTQTSSRNPATFNIPNVNFDNEGSYQCQYEKSISSQSFSSSPSDSVTLSVTVPLLPLVSLARRLLLLLLVLSGVCLVCWSRRRAQSCRPDSSSVLTQTHSTLQEAVALVTVRTSCEDEEDKEEKQDYVNTDTKRKQKEQAGRVEEEEGEYNYVEAAEVFVTVNDNGLEENDESDESGTQLFAEQTVDIYGECENI